MKKSYIYIIFNRSVTNEHLLIKLPSNEQNDKLYLQKILKANK